MHPKLDNEGTSRRGETDTERRARLKRERDLLTEARAELEAGQGVEDKIAEAWLDALERDPDQQVPGVPGSRKRRLGPK